MPEPDEATRNEIRAEIARTLGIAPDKLPALLDSEDTARVLGVKAATLQNWRSSGRYALPFVKIGRLSRYRTGDLVGFISRRTHNAA